jgi:hypothetical protein
MAPQNNGYFELESVPPGSYVLYASLPDNTGGGAGQTGTGVIARAFGRAAFDVGTTDVSDIAITIHHGVDVIGQVYTDVDISTLKGMRVSVQPDDSAARIGLYQQVGGYQAEVGETGAFKIPILPEAMYRVQMTFGGGPSASRAFILGVRQEGADIFDSGFLVGDKPVAPIEIFVSAKSGSVTGTALDAQGRPAPNAVVALVPPAERRHNPTLFRTATANAEGKFTLTGVPPGEFKLFAWRSIPTGANRNPAFIARYENSGMPVTIAADGELRVDATLAVPNP